MLPVGLFIVSVLFALLFGRLGRLVWPGAGTPAVSARADGPGSGRVLPAPSGKKKPPANPQGSSRVRLTMQVVVSLIILLASFYMLLSGGHDGDHEKFAYGSIGTVIGFWLNG